MKTLLHGLVLIIILVPILSPSYFSEEKDYRPFIVIFDKPALLKNLKNISDVSLISKLKEDIKLDHLKFVNWLRDKIEKVRVREFLYTLNGMRIDVPRKMIPLIMSLPYVKSIYPDVRVKAMLSHSLPLIGLNDVLRVENLSGKGIDVAVIDSGIDYNHPDLKSSYCGGYDFVNEDDDPFDDNGHGTHVCGIIAGNGAASDSRYRGVAPNVTLYVYKVIDENGFGYASDVIAGIERAIDPNGDGDFSDRVDIISMSLGVSDGEEGGDPDDIICQAVDRAVDAGVVVVASAGNDGWDIEKNTSRKFTINSPACARKCIAVGAVTHIENSSPSGGPARVALYSSKGPSPLMTVKPDVVAPGGDVNLFSHGADIYNFSIISARAEKTTLGKIVDNYYTKLGGTSMAAPHVTGVIALLMEKHPDWDPLEIRSALRYTARNLGYPLSYQGFGLIDAFNLLENLNSPPPVGLFFDAVDNGNRILLRGVAKARDFESYQILCRFLGNEMPDEFVVDEDGWRIIYTGVEEIEDRILYAWDKEGLKEGWYEIKLVVRDVYEKTAEDYMMVEVKDIKPFIYAPSTVYENEKFTVSLKDSNNNSLISLFVMLSSFKPPLIKIGREVEFRAYNIVSSYKECINATIYAISFECSSIRVEKKTVTIFNRMD